MDAHTVEIDAGLFQGLKELRQRNWTRPGFDPARVASLLLTHAHIDHIGYLPKLVREGFRGPVYCTRPTAELAEILLLDAARLQEEDAAYANRKGFSEHRPALPLYTEDDVGRAMRHLRPVDYGDRLDLGHGFVARFHDAGHILGSASVEVRTGDGRNARTVVFSGDLGQYDAPLHADPKPPPPCDVLVIESTYGNRRHLDLSVADQVHGAFRRAAMEGGTILVPSFAVARVQAVALLVVEMMASGDIPRMPIHVDSPMAVEVTAVYRRYRGSSYLDPELPWSIDPLESELIQFVRTVQESKQLNGLPGPRVIISSSGMLTGGRVLHHFRRLAPDPANVIALVGYQAPGTRGRLLQDGAKTVRLHGEDVPVRATVLTVNGLSAHADSEDLLRWVRSSPSTPGRVFVTHGEPEASAALARRLRDELQLTVTIPALGERFEV